MDQNEFKQRWYSNENPNRRTNFFKVSIFNFALMIVSLVER